MMTLNPEKAHSCLEQLARTRALLELPWGEALESDQARLARRAAALARQQNSAASEATIALLLFRLGEEVHGLDLAVIEKVMNWRPCVGMPGAPDYLLGLAEVNGEILSVIDLGRLLGLPGGVAAASGQVILLGKREHRFGLHVAGLEGIRHVALIEIQPPPVSLPTGQARYWRGMTPEGVIILDAEKLMNAPELTINQEP